MKLPAITLWQPWASLLIQGIKIHETRSWAPPGELIGHRFLIHAAARVPRPSSDWSEDLCDVLKRVDVPMPFGAALGTARLVRAFEMATCAPDMFASDDLYLGQYGGYYQPESRDDHACGSWYVGRWAWRFTDPRPFAEPIRMRGYQRIWYASLDLTADPSMEHGRAVGARRAWWRHEREGTDRDPKRGRGGTPTLRCEAVRVGARWCHVREDYVNGLALCAGIAGLELGLRLALGRRYRSVGYIERDAYSAATLVARMEDEILDRAPVWDDLSTFDGRFLRGCVDIVSAGFPCQPASDAGSRRGVEDERWIWPEVARIIGEVSPRYVYLENVPGLLSVSSGAAFREVLDSLAELGLDAEWDVFSAAGVGAPHLRRRLFILAERVPDADCDGLRFEPERGPGSAQAPHERHAEPLELGKAMADAAFDGVEASREHWSSCAGISRAQRESASVGDSSGSRRKGTAARRDAESESATRCGALGDTDSGRLEVERLAQHSEQQRPPGDQPDGSDPDGILQWPPGPGDADGWGRYLAAGGPEPALRRGAHGLSDRVDRLRCLGNGVVPEVAARAFLVLRARLRG